MRNDNISPEEKLLRLIRGEKKQEKGLPIIKQGASALILKNISMQKIILVIFAFSIIYLVINFIYPLVGLNKIKLPQVEQKNITESEIEPKSETKPYEFYLEGTKGHQIFTSPVSSETAEKSSTTANADLVKDINLVGIISGENPQAIIEDKKIQKTYYVTKGQFIGELQVEDIQEGKVILDYKGQKFELYL